MKKLFRNMIMVLAFVCAAAMLPAEEAGTVQAASKVKISQREAVLCKGNTLKLSLKGTSGKITWKTSNPEVAKVGRKGKVTSYAPGKAVITAKVKGKAKVYKCAVTVKKHSYTKATCTKAAKCRRCGQVKGKKRGHDYRADTCIRCGHVKENFVPTEKQVYKDLMSMKSVYPEGMHWTNDDFYAWNGGGRYYGGYGCVAFAFHMSDTAFGKLPSREHTNFNNLKVGDIIRLNGDTHSVIVLEVHPDYIVIAEGNYNSSIHWGRVISMATLKETGDYVVTRYPR